jgi:G:T-mismatch repair DNA endonuclease (very short patch repair protein)
MAGLQQGQVREGLEGCLDIIFPLYSCIVYYLICYWLMTNYQLKFSAGEYILKY